MYLLTAFEKGYLLTASDVGHHLTTFDVGHPEQFEVIVWLPVLQDVAICEKLEETIFLDPETKNKLAYLVPDSLAPLFSIFVLSARGVMDLDFMNH